MSARLVIFARLPVPGKAKSRLAASVGPETAARLYKLCAEHIFQECTRCAAVQPILYCSCPQEAEAVAQWLQSVDCSMPVAPQVQHPCLGDRMLAALSEASQLPQPPKPSSAARGAAGPRHRAAQGNGQCRRKGVYKQQQEVIQQQEQQEGREQPQGQHQHMERQDAVDGTPPYTLAAQGCTPSSRPGSSQVVKVIIVGSDIPDLSAATIERAAEALDQYDAVVGPAKDGGYYLLGLTTRALAQPLVQAGALFEGISWSNGAVLEQQLAAGQQMGLRWAPLTTLPRLRDIDTLQDLQQWAGSQNPVPVCASCASNESALPLELEEQEGRGSRSSSCTRLDALLQLARAVLEPR